MVIKKILCPTDFSDASYHALRVATELALENNAEVCVLHVGVPSTVVTRLTALTPHAQGEAVRCAEAICDLCRLLEERIPPNTQCRPLLKSGQAAAEIVQAAHEENADMIALTSYGATGRPPNDNLGRVASEVLHLATCPVLVINARTISGLSEHNQNEPQSRILRQ